LEKGDVFLIASDGLWRALSPKEILAAVRAHGVDAATRLVEQGARDRPDHPRDNLTAVALAIA
jgi:serine/threonine protein phosphatase PrpC